jgi:hypothetical protein
VLLMSDAMPPDWASAQSAIGPRYCLRCRALLDDAALGDETGKTRCRRCGLPFSPDRPETFATRRPPRQWKLWVVCVLIAIIAGVLAFARLVGQNRLGYVAFFGIPFAVGAFLGYATRASIWLTLLLSLFATSGIAFAIVSLDLSGLFCGLTLGGLLLGPALVGAIAGWAVRKAMRGAAYDRRKYFFLTIAVVLPFGADQAESRWPMEIAVAEVSTSSIFDTSLQQAWDSIVFYEEVAHDRPLVLKLGLPRPLRAEGRKGAVGDIERCVYEKGYLVKRITRVEGPRLLAFDVIEQHLHFEHDVELEGGSFVLTPLGESRTRVVLTTRYRRLLRPAWLWEPMERHIIHTLHAHVLEGMRTKAAR